MDTPRQADWNWIDAEVRAADLSLHGDLKKEDLYGEVDNDPFGNEEMAEVKYRD
jgi:hypothetical protein